MKSAKVSNIIAKIKSKKKVVAENVSKITLANKDFDLVTRLWFSEGFLDAEHDVVVRF